MTEFDYLKIAKWVLIVLLAGFIGQFGKSLAKHLMEKARLKRQGLPQSEETMPTPGREHIKGSPTGVKELPTDAGQDISQEEKAKQEKKLAKTLAKQRKKGAKALKKQGEL
ncbi:MAG: hypothetical protein JRC53_00640 [Deltaproteobacteria bacterium]|nr:hypothetical protein [Deltaproteobacteria bacterium]